MFIVPGCKAGTLDIAPNYAGITFGISNCIANIAGILAPLVTGLLLRDGVGIIGMRQYSY